MTLNPTSDTNPTILKNLTILVKILIIMGPISDAVDRVLDSRDNTEQTVLQKMELRHRLEKDLTELTTTIDNQSRPACQDWGGIGPFKELVNGLTVSIYNNIENSDLSPTTEQLAWLHSRLDKLHGLLQSRGGKHIQDLKRDRYNDFLQINAGTGYTKRFLRENWSVFKQNPSHYQISELQDRVLLLSDTVHALSENQ